MLRKRKLSRLGPTPFLVLVVFLLFCTALLIVMAPRTQSLSTLMVSLALCVVFVTVGIRCSVKATGSFLPVILASGMLLAMGSAYQTLFGPAPVAFLAITMAAIFAAYLLGRRLLWDSLSHPDRLFWIVTGTIVFLLVINYGLGRGGADAASRLWIDIGPFSFQPGEFVKYLLMLLAAFSVGDTKKGIVYSMVSLVSCLFFLMMKDLGNAAVIFVTFVVATFLLFDSVHLSVSLLAMAVMAVAFAAWQLPYVRQRLFNTFQAMGNTDSVQQAYILRAVMRGYFTGIAPGDIPRILNPDNVFAIESDAALAGLWTAFGFPMLAIAVLCYVALAYVTRWHKAVYPACHLFLYQFSVFITTQVLLNLGGSLDFLPFTGVVAPMISAGGSSMLVCGLCIGTVMAAVSPQIAPAVKRRSLRHASK